MTRQCTITGKKSAFGRSYALRGIAKKKKGIGIKITGVTNRRFNPNLKTKKLFDPVTKQMIRIKVTPAGLRSIDKNGLTKTLKKIKKKK